MYEFCALEHGDGGVKVGHPEAQALQSRMSITLSVKLISYEAHVCVFLSLKTGADLQVPMPQMVATRPYDWTAGRPTLTVWVTPRRAIHTGHPASLPKCTPRSHREAPPFGYDPILRRNPTFLAMNYTTIAHLIRSLARTSLFPFTLTSETETHLNGVRSV